MKKLACAVCRVSLLFVLLLTETIGATTLAYGDDQLLAPSGQQLQQQAAWERLPAAALPVIAAALGREQAQYAADRADGELKFENRDHGLAADFSRAGVEVRSGAFRFGLALRSYGYGKALKPVVLPQATSNQNRIEYRRGPLTEWYVNGPLGLEQGFTLTQPHGRRTGQPLTLALTLTSDLTPALEANGRGLTLRRGSVTMLRYTKLAAFDANERELPAWMELRGRVLLIRVDDSAARYPIVVDPFFVGEPFVRVNPNQWVEFNWRTDVAWFGRVEVFTHSDGTGLVLTREAEDGGGNPTAARQQVVRVPVGPVLAPDTTYYFRITAIDPTKLNADTVTQLPLPSFFTGASAEPPGPDPKQPKLAAAEGAADDRFGGAVAFSGDTIVVGASFTNSLEGAAYVFVKPQAGWATTDTYTAKLTASDGFQGLHFGTAVAIEADTVAVGVRPNFFNQEGVYIYVKPGGGWAGNLHEGAKLTLADPNTGGLLGASLAIAGNTVVAGAEYADLSKGAAFVFVKPAAGWTGNLHQTAKLSASDGSSFAADQFGHSVGISGNTIVVGAYNEGTTGAVAHGFAYIFVKPAGGWSGTLTEAAKLMPSDGEQNERFGVSVGISADTVVVGDHSLRFSSSTDPRFLYLQAYVFVKPATGWAGNLTESAKLTASDDATEVLYIFNYVHALFSGFGSAAAISGDTVMIGAPGDTDAKGAVYKFQKPEGGWSGTLTETAKLTASDGAPYDFLGTSVAISGDTAVAGASGDDIRKGSAYIFTGTTDSIPPAITLTTPPDGAVYTLNQAVNADYGCQDEAGGSGLASCVGTVANGAPLNTASVGAKSFVVTAADNAGNPASSSHSYSVIYSFSGFFAPLNNLPTLNRMKAGAGAPLKFSLGGDQGLGIFAAGYPSSLPIACDANVLVDSVEETLTAGASGLTYDATSAVYTYVWKTEKSWARSCRQLVIKLNDGTFHRLNFTFEK